MSTPTVEGFSLSHAAILDGSTGAEEVDGDIYGIRSGSLEASTDSYDNTGDDRVMSTWFWFNFATITIQAGYVPFKLIALMTNQTVQSSGTAPNDHYSIPLWAEDSFNVAPRPMWIKVPSKDSAGVPRELCFVLYKVQFSPITFNGPQYKDGLAINYSGRVLMSDVDEQGNSLTKAAPGRLISQPAA